MKIDFYVLETTNETQRLFFVCQLIEKIYAENTKTIYVHMSTKKEAEKFDALLWTYKEDSFIPHELYNMTHNAPVQIGYEEGSVMQGILINLHDEIPHFYKQFDQVIEIVFNQGLSQQTARARYKLYRNQGYEINTIK